MLKNKIPPPIVTLMFSVLIFYSADYFGQFYFIYQSIISLIIAFIGICIISVAIVQFKQFKTTVNPLKPEAASSLVTTGIYRLSRNPMYLGMLLLIISLWIKKGAVSGFILVPGFIVYMNYFQIFPEERSMKTLFSGRYEVYCRQVRRWL
jgi:protein-S-isoprenylcysteine O-methyltransferase Ste14